MQTRDDITAKVEQELRDAVDSDAPLSLSTDDLIVAVAAPMVTALLARVAKLTQTVDLARVNLERLQKVRPTARKTKAHEIDEARLQATRTALWAALAPVSHRTWTGYIDGNAVLWQHQLVDRAVAEALAEGTGWNLSTGPAERLLAELAAPAYRIS